MATGVTTCQAGSVKLQVECGCPVEGIVLNLFGVGVVRRKQQSKVPSSTMTARDLCIQYIGHLQSASSTIKGSNNTSNKLHTQQGSYTKSFSGLQKQTSKHPHRYRDLPKESF